MTNKDNRGDHREELLQMELADIIDVPAIQSLLEDFYNLAHISASIIDLKGKVLVGVGWQEVCTKFHRAHPKTCKHCTESDVQLSRGVLPGEFRLYKCKNGMWDVATPIMVGSRQVGNLFSGQFFFADEDPDYKLFRSQAAQYGFDEESYIAELDKVPRLSRASVNSGMAFLVKLAQMISSLSYSNTELTSSLKDRQQAEEMLRSSMEKKRFLAEIIEKSNQPLGIGYPDGRLGLVNHAFCELTGYSAEELQEINWNATLTPPEWIEPEMAALEEIRRAGKPVRYQKEYIRRDGSRIPVELLVHAACDEAGDVQHYYAFVTDITERKQAEEKLHQLTDRLLLATRAAEVGIWDLDLRTDKLIWDDAMCRLYGVTPDQFTGSSDAWQAALHPEDRSRSLKEVEMALRGEKEFDTEFRVLLPDQSVHHIKAIGLVQRDSSDKAVRMLGTNWDVSERKHAEEALLASEQRYHSLFNNMLEGFAYCRMLYKDGKPRDFIYLDVNFAFESLTGLKNVVGQKVSSVIPGIRDTNPELFEIYGRVAMTGESEKFETYIDSLGIWFSIAVYSTEKEYFVSVFDNISERKKSEETLHKSFQEIEDLYNNAPCGYHSIDSRGVFVRMNDTELRWLGYSREELIGKMNIRDVLSEEGARKFEESFSLLKEKGRIADMEREFIRRNGSTMTTLASGIAIKDKDGNFVISRTTLHDITERKKEEEEKEKLKAQLLQAQKMEAVGQLAGGIAHDFNNILTAIIGYGHILKLKLKADAPLITYADNILSLSERAANLTHSLLAFSRKQVMNLRPLDLNEIIRKMDKLLFRIIGEDIEVRTVLSDRDLIVMADQGQMEQVLMNFATNSRDAMPSGGLLSIGTEETYIDREFIKEHGFGEEGRYAVILISDTGTGMQKDIGEKIFEPFFTTKGVGKGTGLGLSIVYGIVKQHKGHIKVCSEPGKGTIFRIYLPLIQAKAEENKPGADLGLESGTETILLAEDNTEVMEFTRKLLEDCGYKVIGATDGQDAVDKFYIHKDEIELLVFDVIMPKKNGSEAYDRIRKIKPDIKVLFISGYSDNIIAAKRIPAERLNLIGKPVSPSVLLKRIREVLAA